MKLRRSSLPAVVAAALIFAACGGGSSDSAPVEEAPDEAATTVADEPVDTTPEPEPEPGPEPEPEPEPDVADARCANSQGDADRAEFEEVECDQPHNAEFAASVPAPEGDAPADDIEFDIALTTVCLDSVEALAGQPLAEFGPEVAYRADTAPGESFSGEVECWLRSSAFGALGASLRDVDLATALGDFVTLASVPIGECYLPAPDNNGSISVGTLVDCETQYADQILGPITVEDGPYPGEDALIAFADEQCPVLAAAADFDLVGDSTSPIFMFETEWTAYGIRDMICTHYRASDYEVESTCSIQIPSEGHDPVPCDQPHDSEFVQSIAPPAGSLPLDPTEAEVLMTQHCAPVVSSFLGGRDLASPGIGVGFEANVGLGEAFESDVNCFAVVGSPVALNAAIADVGLTAALGEFSILAELEPGTCFTFAPDSFDLGVVVGCDAPDALISIGNFVVEDDGPHPGDDPLRALRFERCTELLAASSLAADPSSVSGTFPAENSWTSLGRRTITCDATPL